LQKELKGTGISRKTVMAEAVKFAYGRRTPSRYSVTEPTAEWRRLENAIEKTYESLSSVYTHMLSGDGKAFADIVRTRRMIVNEESFRHELQTALDQQGYNAEYILDSVVKQQTKNLAPIDDPRFRERTQDLLAVMEHVYYHLETEKDAAQTASETGSIVVARDLSPSDSLFPVVKHAAGLITETGGVTSCAALLARVLEIPAVVGVPDAFETVTEGSTLVLDGISGSVILDPEPKTAARYRTEVRAELEIKDPLGLHVRPAAQLAETASTFESDTYISHKGHDINAKSTIGLLTLNAPPGSRLLVVCKGPDASAALAAIRSIAL